MVGALLKKLDDLKIADNTIVIYSTDNGAETASWPDGGTTPFFGEKGTTWEGGFRVPLLVRWPGVVKPGSTANARYAYVHAIALNSAGRTDEALQTLQASDARQPADRDTLLALVTIIHDAGRPDAALTRAPKARRRRPRGTTARRPTAANDPSALSRPSSCRARRGGAGWRAGIPAGAPWKIHSWRRHRRRRLAIPRRRA